MGSEDLDHWLSKLRKRLDGGNVANQSWLPRDPATQALEGELMEAALESSLRHCQDTTQEASPGPLAIEERFRKTWLAETASSRRPITKVRTTEIAERIRRHRSGGYTKLPRKEEPRNSVPRTLELGKRHFVFIDKSMAPEHVRADAVRLSCLLDSVLAYATDSRHEVPMVIEIAGCAEQLAIAFITMDSPSESGVEKDARSAGCLMLCRRPTYSGVSRLPRSALLLWRLLDALGARLEFCRDGFRLLVRTRAREQDVEPSRGNS